MCRLYGVHAYTRERERERERFSSYMYINTATVHVPMLYMYCTYNVYNITYTCTCTCTCTCTRRHTMSRCVCIDSSLFATLHVSTLKMKGTPRSPLMKKIALNNNNSECTVNSVSPDLTLSVSDKVTTQE